MRVLLALAVLICSRPLWAQCGARQEQCAGCHAEGTQGAPACDGARPWHRNHAFASFCSECHGGDAAARDIGAAHAGLAWPLANEGARCATCHPLNAAALVRPYLAARDASRPGQRKSSPLGNGILAVLAVALGAGGAAYVVHNERRR